MGRTWARKSLTEPTENTEKKIINFETWIVDFGN